jgi:hypothetical protein
MQKNLSCGQKSAKVAAWNCKTGLTLYGRGTEMKEDITSVGRRYAGLPEKHGT